MKSDDRLIELLGDHKGGMSKFQEDNFVTIKAGGTDYGQYKQALRELYSRINSLRDLIFKKKKAQIDIDKQQHIIDTSKDEFEIRYAELERDQKIFGMESINRSILETDESMQHFYNQATTLKDKLGNLDNKRIESLEEEMWIFKMKEMSALDVVTSGNISRGTFETISALPTHMKQLMFKELSNTDKLLEWHQTLEPTELPAIEYGKKYIELPSITTNKIE